LKKIEIDSTKISLTLLEKKKSKIVTSLIEFLCRERRDGGDMKLKLLESAKCRKVILRVKQKQKE